MPGCKALEQASVSRHSERMGGPEWRSRVGVRAPLAIVTRLGGEVSDKVPNFRGQGSFCFLRGA